MYPYNPILGSLFIFFGIAILVAVASTFIVKIALIIIALYFIKYGLNLCARQIHRNHFNDLP